MKMQWRPWLYGTQTMGMHIYIFIHRYIHTRTKVTSIYIIYGNTQTIVALPNVICQKTLTRRYRHISRLHNTNITIHAFSLLEEKRQRCLTCAGFTSQTECATYGQYQTCSRNFVSFASNLISSLCTANYDQLS